MRTAADIKAEIDSLRRELAGVDPSQHLGVCEFARLVGVSPTTVMRFREGKELDLKNAKKFLPYLSHCLCCGQKLQAKP
jgi:hypothetical protein